MTFRFKETVRHSHSHTTDKSKTSKYQSKMRLSNRFTAHQKVVDKLNSIEGMTWTAGVSKFVQSKSIA